MEDREREWIDEIRAGDEAAFREVFFAYYPKLCRFAAEYVTPADRARDVVQDVFLKIWERRRAWNVHGSLRAYLYQAVRNQALNYVRQQDTRRNGEDRLERSRTTSERHTAEDTFRSKELSEAVERAIEQLPRRRRMAFLLHRRHGFTYVEVARIMDISPKTVENQIGRALKFLREELATTFSRELG